MGVDECLFAFAVYTSCLAKKLQKIFGILKIEDLKGGIHYVQCHPDGDIKGIIC